MQVKFRDKKLEKCFLESEMAYRKFGQKVAKKFIQRVQIIQSIPDHHTLKKAPGLDCHQLKGDRMGEWAVKLTDRWRLIFTFEDDKMNVVMIEEVSNHYDD